MSFETDMTSDMSCSTRTTAVPALAIPLKQFVESGRVVMIKAGGRLIEQENRRPGCERAGNFEQSSIDMGERLARECVRSGIADQREQ